MIFFYDGTTIMQVTNNELHDDAPQISGSNVVWQAHTLDGSEWDIFFYDGVTVSQLPDTNMIEDDPQISGSNVVWRSNDEEDNEIFLSINEPDFDNDGDVDAADFALWESNFGLLAGATFAQGDANFDGKVDGKDFLDWQRSFTGTISPATSTAIPEPSSLLLGAVAGMGLMWRRSI